MKLTLATGWLCAGFILAAVGAVLWRWPIMISFRYFRQGKTDTATVEVWLLRRFGEWRLEVSEAAAKIGSSLLLLSRPTEEDLKEDTDFPVNEKKRVRYSARQFRLELTTVTKYRHIMRRLFSSAVCRELSWRTVFGAGDPALTGILCGAAWMIKGLALQAMRQRVRFLSPPAVAVVPFFSGIRVEVSFACIFRVPLGNVIIAVASLIKLVIEEVGGIGRTSNSGADENDNGEHPRNG